MAERQSAALKRIMDALLANPRAQVLDLGGASQASIDHLAGAERRLYAEDVLRPLASAVTRREPAQKFLDANLSYPGGLFDAALCWDVLAYAPADYLPALAKRLHEILRSGGLALAYFPNSAARAVGPPGRYEILGRDLLRRTDARSSLGEARFLTRREIDRQFGGYFAITDVITKDAFHELLLVRKPEGSR